MILDGFPHRLSFAWILFVLANKVGSTFLRPAVKDGHIPPNLLQGNLEFDTHILHILEYDTYCKYDTHWTMTHTEVST